VDGNVNANFKFNQETEFVPILGLISESLNKPSDDEDSALPVKATATSIQENHHPALLSVLANELSVSTEEIHDFEL
jgi:aspartyl aminopeptidase